MTQPLVVGRCAVHPERDAVATCSRCGNYGCIDCLGGSSTTCVSCEEATGSSRYHVVPLWRFIVMNLLSVGLYQLYWMYLCWKQIKRSDKSDIWPIARAIFGGFTYFSLLTDLNLYATNRSLPVGELGPVLGIGYLVTTMTWRLPEPWSMLSLVNVLFLIPAVRRIWAISGDGARGRAAGWSLRHTIASVIAVVFWVLAGLGAALEAERS